MKLLQPCKSVASLLILSCQFAASQGTALFDRLSLEEGLSQSTVEAIVQDKQGVIWLGTNDGLNRYDGYEFVTYRYDPTDTNSPSDNYIHSMCLDDSGFIWIGTNNGLNKLDPALETFTRYLHDPANPDGISHSFVVSVCKDAYGNIWAGTFGRGLNLYDRSNDRFIHFEKDSLSETSLSDNTIMQLTAAPNGDLWIGTFHGWVNRIHRDILSTIAPDVESGRRPVIPFERYFLLPNKTAGAQEEFIWAIEHDRDDQIWIGTHRDGLLHFDAESRTITNYRRETDPLILGSNNVQSLLKDDDGILWIGTDAAGLTRFDPASGAPTNYRHDPGNPRSLSDNSIWSLYRDQQGVLWVGTDFGGLSILDPHRFVFEHYPTMPGQLHDRQIWSFHEGQDGVIWVGTDGGGLTAFDPRAESFRTFRHNPNNSASLSNDYVMSIADAGDGNLWIGTAGGGLNRLDRRTGAMTRIRDRSPTARSRTAKNIRALSPSADGTCWIGTYGSGLFLFDPVESSFTPVFPQSGADHITPTFVESLLEDSSGILWIGTFGDGLFRYDHRSGTLEQFSSDPPDPASLSNNKVNVLHFDRRNRLWIGTFGGLCMYETSGRTFRRYTVKDGLPNDVIYGILEDEHGLLWLSTNRGVSRFDPSLRTFMNFTVKDGLQSYEFNRGAALRAKDGLMFFGGVNGFNVFRPGRIRFDETPPPVIITSFKVMNQRQNLSRLLHPSGVVELGPDVTDFSFEFAALDYTSAGNNHYAYRMEGIDDDWINTGTRRYAGYAHLPAGEYTFRVKGANSDGVWNETGTAVRISILPPVWGTWWFRSSAVLLALSIGFGFYRVRVTALEKEKHAQQETSRRLIELQEQERRRIAGGLHDSLGQNLLILKSSIDQTASRHKLAPEVADELNGLSVLAQEALGEVREISFDLHPHVLDRLGLRKGIETIVVKMERVSQLSVSTDLCETNGILGKEMEIHLYRIVQEALTNIVKHSEASSATVSMVSEDVGLRLAISDNGRGFDATSFLTRPPHERSLGLIDIAERVRLLGGTFGYESSPARGTTLTVVVPPRSTEVS